MVVAVEMVVVVVLLLDLWVLLPGTQPIGTVGLRETRRMSMAQGRATVPQSQTERGW
jgi:hypothetical protein